ALRVLGEKDPEVSAWFTANGGSVSSGPRGGLFGLGPRREGELVKYSDGKTRPHMWVDEDLGSDSLADAVIEWARQGPWKQAFNGWRAERKQRRAAELDALDVEDAKDAYSEQWDFIRSANKDLREALTKLGQGRTSQTYRVAGWTSTETYARDWGQDLSY